jgi:hypothetical protein
LGCIAAIERRLLLPVDFGQLLRREEDASLEVAVSMTAEMTREGTTDGHPDKVPSSLFDHPFVLDAIAICSLVSLRLAWYHMVEAFHLTYLPSESAIVPLANARPHKGTQFCRHGGTRCHQPDPQKPELYNWILALSLGGSGNRDAPSVVLAHRYHHLNTKHWDA